LAICIIDFSGVLAQFLEQYLGKDSCNEETGRYALTQLSSETQFLQFINQENLHIDCFIFQNNPGLQTLLDRLQQQAIFSPAVVLNFNLQPFASEDVILTGFPASQEFATSKQRYHPAVLELPQEQLSLIKQAIEVAISKFIQLLPMSQTGGSVLPSLGSPPPNSAEEQATHQSLIAQQMRLANKLKERLGYLGLYYKRSPQNFLRHMSLPQREELLQQLKADYREIILSYFSNESGLNQKIDNFVNISFFADVPVAQIVEMHMGLMDEFSKQLKLEGRSDEILQDYRLTLIDTIAHLCEMYRRSIPRESISTD
jgi:circadian clock protein KaiA